MENQVLIPNQEKPSQTISLKIIVAELVSQFQPMAVKRRSFIENDVPDDLYVNADKDNLVSIISSLFNSIFRRSRGSCIRVSARRYHNIIVVRLKDSTNGIINISDQDWQEVKLLTKKLDHCIIENDIRKEHPIFTFSFCNLANAA